MKPAILLLHGALGSSSSLDDLALELSKDRKVYQMNFPGHGGAAADCGFTLQSLTQALNDFIETHIQHPVEVFGYSMGGFVALNAAKNGSKWITKIYTLATKIIWDATIAEQENKNLDLHFLEQKAPQFIAELQKIHGEDQCEKLLLHTQNFLAELGKYQPLRDEELGKIQIPVLYMLGDNDKMVSLLETEKAVKCTPNSVLNILPNTAHQIHKVNKVLVADCISESAL